MECARRPAIAALLLLLVTLAGYANSFPGSFIWDDTAEIVDNPVVAALDLREIFTTDYCGRAANCGTYRPLTVLSYALNRRLSGTNPTSYHAVNVALHAAVTLLLFLLLEALGFGRAVAWLAAALFGVHPIHTEVVNIVTFRSESLAALFVLLALLASVQRTRGRDALAVAAFAGALLSKENGLVFLLLLPLVDAFRGASLRRMFDERRTLYAAVVATTAAWFAVRHLVLDKALVPPDLIYATDNPLVALPPVARILTALKAQVFYAGMLLMPVRLQAIYTGQSVGVVTSLLSAWGLLSATVGAGCLALAALSLRHRAAAGFGYLFSVAGFALTANFLFTMPVLLGERLAYLPSAGFCVAAAALLPVDARPPVRTALRALCCLYLLVLGGLLVRRNRDFAGELPLAREAVRLDPGNVRAWHYLGGAFLKTGDRGQAEQALRTAIAADPAFPDTYLMLGRLLNDAGRHREARDLVRDAIAKAPGESPHAFTIIAEASLGLGAPDEALAWADRAAQGLQLDEASWDLRARILEARGDTPGAVDARRRAYALNGGADAGLRLAELLLRSGGEEEAAAILGSAERRLREQLQRGENAATLNSYGLALALQRNFSRAVPAFRRATELDPASPLYRGNYERALAATGGDAPPQE